MNILNAQIILILGLLIAVIITALLVVIYRQQKQINQLKKPRYGFLGKSLYSVLAFMLMASVGISIFGGPGGRQVQPPPDFVSGPIDSGISVEHQHLGDQLYQLELLVPTQILDEAVQQVEWLIIGEDFRYAYQNPSQAEEYALELTLPGGTYQIGVEVVTSAAVYQIATTIDVP